MSPAGAIGWVNRETVPWRAEFRSLSAPQHSWAPKTRTPGILSRKPRVSSPASVKVRALCRLSPRIDHAPFVHGVIVAVVRELLTATWRGASWERQNPGTAHAPGPRIRCDDDMS